MVLINGGPALLGPDRHRVVANAFYIDKLEVSNAAYADFCHATGRPLPEDAESPRLPVVNVPFPDAEAFAHWAGKRLPRAEEWEKAARGADGLRFPWGDLLDLSRVNLGGPNAAARRAEVDSYPQGASPYGVLNLLGNVWEWVDERERPDESTLKQLANQDWARKLKPPPRLDETYVQIRGGSYLANRPEDLAALVYGSALLPSRVRRPDVGFRCVKDLAKP